MAKGKKGKKGGKNKKETVVTDEITEVERELFQIQITDLTRKVERLKARCLELETSNEEFQKNYAKLDQERADIIAFLQKTTEQKTEEIEELEERVNGLIKSRDEEVSTYTVKIKKMEHDFKIMHEQLSAEIKLLSGKLNSLEEFRLQRDELMNKFKQQEINMEEQEERHKRTLYDVERKFVIGKDKLVKEMESRLCKLSTDFRDATEMRIAATTHHAIRENIAINNELDLMLEMQHKLTDENNRFKEQDKQLRLQFQLHQQERSILLAKNRHQIKLLNKMATEHSEMKEQLSDLEYLKRQVIHLEAGREEKRKELEASLLYVRHLQQKLHAAACEQNDLQIAAQTAHQRYRRLCAIIKTSAMAIHEALGTAEREEDKDEALVQNRRETLLARLLELMDISNIEFMPVPMPSVETIVPYESGALGLIPKVSFLDVAKSEMIAKSKPEEDAANEDLLGGRLSSVRWQSKIQSIIEDTVGTKSSDAIPLRKTPAVEDVPESGSPTDSEDAARKES